MPPAGWLLRRLRQGSQTGLYALHGTSAIIDEDGEPIEIVKTTAGRLVRHDARVCVGFNLATHAE